MAAKKTTEQPKFVRAVWEGRRRFFPREGRVVDTGDIVHVSQEQLDDPNTPCSPPPARTKNSSTSKGSASGGADQED